MDPKGTVLIVDDEKTILDVGRKILTDFGYEVDIAVSGLEAIGLCRNRAGGFGLVILDLGLKDMGGLDCLRILKEEYPGLKVVICTGSDDAAFEAAAGLGACGFLPKPYRMHNLVALVEKEFHS